jgi:hypothetical protein
LLVIALQLASNLGLANYQAMSATSVIQVAGVVDDAVVAAAGTVEAAAELDDCLCLKLGWVKGSR